MGGKNAKDKSMMISCKVLSKFWKLLGGGRNPLSPPPLLPRSLRADIASAQLCSISNTLGSLVIPVIQRSMALFSRRWRQKSSGRGVGASDRGAKMTEICRFRTMICQICTDNNVNFLRWGARCSRRYGCNPPPPGAITVFSTLPISAV